MYAARSMRLDLGSKARQQLMDGYLELKPWPDVPEALDALRSAGIRLAFLSNFTRAMLDAAIKSSKLEGVFERVLSTDDVKTYKPDPRAYQMGVDALGLSRGEIAFAAFAGWDAAGAGWFGYRTFWVNRLNRPVEELGVTPDAASASLSDLVAFVTSGR